MIEGLNISKPEGYLNKGVKPIMTSVGSFEDYEELKKNYPEANNLDNNLGLEKVENVDWFSDLKTLKENELLNAGSYTYVMSKVDSSNKISKGFHECTGLVVTGVEGRTGKSISFITHQALTEASFKKEEFITHLKQQLELIKNQCVPGTFDAVIIGGEIDDNPLSIQNYNNSLKVVSAEVKLILDFDPIVINGPKIKANFDEIYYDNEKRRLFLVRSKVNQIKNSIDKDFLPADFSARKVDKYKNRWK